MSAPQPWRKIQAIGNARRERVRRLILRALSPSLPGLEVALESGRFGPVTTAYRKDTLNLHTSVREGLQSEFLGILGAAGKATVDFGIARSITRQPIRAAMRVAEFRKVNIDFDFNTASPEAIAWAEKNAAQLITNISDEQMFAVRAMVADGIKNGKTPKTIAKNVRGVVGLNRVQTRKFVRLLDTTTEAKALAYAKKARTDRSMTIARTEVLKSANEGQRQAWQQARSAGVLTGEEAREWIVTYDERTCEICAPMEGQIVGLNELFKLPDGSAVGGPPAHPRCRCAQGLTERPGARIRVPDVVVEQPLYEKVPVPRALPKRGRVDAARVLEEHTRMTGEVLPPLPSGSKIVAAKKTPMEALSQQLQDLKTVAQDEDVMALLAGTRQKFIITDGTVTDVEKRLKGVAPRGWTPGSTWDNVKGAYAGESRKIISGGSGLGQSAGSVLAHEVGHAIDAAMRVATRKLEWNSGIFQDVWRRTISNNPYVNPYFKQGGIAGMSESFAEAYSVYAHHGIGQVRQMFGREYAELFETTMQEVRKRGRKFAANAARRKAKAVAA